MPDSLFCFGSVRSGFRADLSNLNTDFGLDPCFMGLLHGSASWSLSELVLGVWSVGFCDVVPASEHLLWQPLRLLNLWSLLWLSLWLLNLWSLLWSLSLSKRPCGKCLRQ